MISAEKAQAAIDAIRAVCNEHGVVLYGSSIDDRMPVEIAIVASEGWIDDEAGNEVMTWHCWQDYLYVNSIGDTAINSKTQGLE